MSFFLVVGCYIRLIVIVSLFNGNTHNLTDAEKLQRAILYGTTVPLGTVAKQMGAISYRG